MSQITYFKFKSPYEDDITKNCALSGAEVDSNFFTLESRDIKSIKVFEKDLIITLYNGKEIKAEGAFDKFLEDLSFSFDSQKGELTILQDGEEQVIDGFITKDNYSEFINNLSENVVYSDNTIEGNGKKEAPLSISKQQLTGKYKPADKFIDVKNSGALPLEKEPKIGERIVTLESIDTFGYLYDFNGANSINVALKEENKGWRVPSKEDWDDLLNSIEEEKFRNHNEITNSDLGAIAGKKLKSIDGWSTDMADKENYGNDLYGMNILPCGYVDEFGNYQHNNKIAWFWTLTDNLTNTVYTKRFDANKSTVYQKLESTNVKLSIRLIKDYSGDNYSEYEEILGTNFKTALLPSLKNKKSIWTTENFLINVFNPYKPITSTDNVLKDVYFINEWDGEKWVVNELKEGESIVIKQCELSTDKNQEYIVTDGKLILSNKIVYNNILDEVSTQLEVIDNRVSTNEGKITKIENDINSLNSKTDSTKQDIISINGKIVNIQDDLRNKSSEISDNRDNIANEILNRKANEAKINSDIKNNQDNINSINGIVTNNTNEINSTKSKIDNEISERKQETNSIKNSVLDVDNSSIVKQGTIFDKTSGVLTLKTKSEDIDDIKVQLSFNFGDF